MQKTPENRLKQPLEPPVTARLGVVCFIALSTVALLPWGMGMSHVFGRELLAEWKYIEVACGVTLLLLATGIPAFFSMHWYTLKSKLLWLGILQDHHSGSIPPANPLRAFLSTVLCASIFTGLGLAGESIHQGFFAAMLVFIRFIDWVFPFDKIGVNRASLFSWCVLPLLLFHLEKELRCQSQTILK